MRNAINQREGTNEYAFTPHVYEVHGNVKYMHCSNEDEDHSKLFYLGPSHSKVEPNHVPLCTHCSAPMKPHCMFFDECYSEYYYRERTVSAFLEDKMDCLIVIGTALATGLARRIVNIALDKIQCPVIEVNIESSINRGFNLQVLEKSEIALNTMFNEYYKLMLPKAQN